MSKPSVTFRSLKPVDLKESLRIVRQALISLGTLVLLIACAREGEPLVPDLVRPRAVNMPTTPTPRPPATPPAVLPDPSGTDIYRQSIDFKAAASGNVVVVSVINNQQNKKFLIGPKMFGVIVDRKLYTVKPGEVLSQFPVKTLGFEEGVTGAFKFQRLGNLVGKKMVLNCPGAGQYFAVITPRTQSATGRTRSPVQPNQP